MFTKNQKWISLMINYLSSLNIILIYLISSIYFIVFNIKNFIFKNKIFGYIFFILLYNILIYLFSYVPIIECTGLPGSMSPLSSSNSSINEINISIDNNNEFYNNTTTTNSNSSSNSSSSSSSSKESIGILDTPIQITTTPRGMIKLATSAIAGSAMGYAAYKGGDIARVVVKDLPIPIPAKATAILTGAAAGAAYGFIFSKSTPNTDGLITVNIDLGSVISSKTNSGTNTSSGSINEDINIETNSVIDKNNNHEELIESIINLSNNSSSSSLIPRNDLIRSPNEDINMLLSSSDVSSILFALKIIVISAIFLLLFIIIREFIRIFLLYIQKRYTINKYIQKYIITKYLNNFDKHDSLYKNMAIFLTFGLLLMILDTLNRLV